MPVAERKFDLDRWDADYFVRLKDFVAKADARGILVEIVLFSNWYGKGTMSPLHPSNNVNSLDPVAPDAVHTLANGTLLARQEAIVRKVVAELNTMDNVYFEIQNEPDATSPDTREIPAARDTKAPARVKVATAASLAWQARVAGWIRDDGAQAAQAPPRSRRGSPTRASCSRLSIRTCRSSTSTTRFPKA